jgi:hypothetical protein
MAMDTSVIVSAIAAVSSVIIAALSYLFTKWREREADWRKWKHEQYKEFVTAISGITGSDSTPEGQRSFARACNTLHYIGSKGVIDAMHAYQEGTSLSNPNRYAEHDALLTNLIWEIRKDAKIPRTPKLSNFSVKLWSSGTNDSQEQS